MNALLNNYIETAGIDFDIPEYIKNFKQINMHHVLKIDTDSSHIKEVTKINCRVKIADSYIADSTDAVSPEGSVTSRGKLMIKGELFYNVEYISGEAAGTLHSKNFTLPFSNFMYLENLMSSNDPMIVTPYIEDFSVVLMKDQRFFCSTLLLLTAFPSISNTVEFIEPEDNDGCLPSEFPVSSNVSEARPFLQFNTDEIIDTDQTSGEITLIHSNILEGEVVSIKIIDTAKGFSPGGQRLTGKAASITFKYKYKILYEDSDSFLHGLENEFFRTVYIALPSTLEGTDPESLINNSLLRTKLELDNIVVRQFGRFSIYISVNCLAELYLTPTYQLCYSTSSGQGAGCLGLSYVDGSRNSLIIKEKNSRTIKPSWSWDGHMIAYLNDLKGKYHLNIYNFHSRKLLTLPPVRDYESVSSYCWLKDGRSIILTGSSKGEKELYKTDIYNMKQVKLTSGRGQTKSYNPKLSPDGKRILFLRSTAQVLTLCCMNNDGTENICIFASPAIKDYDWCSDNTTVACIYGGTEKPDTLCLIDSETSEKTTLLYTNKIYSLKKIKLSPDGRFIAIIGTGTSSDNIYLYDMDLKRLINLTENRSNVSITDFVWKIDSSTLFYVCTDFGLDSIYAISAGSRQKRQIINGISSETQLSCRPKLL